MKKSFPARSVVFTNLSHIVVRGLMVECHAIVISDNPDLDEGRERRIRLVGFGTTCLWLVFSLELRTADHEWVPRPPPPGGVSSLRGELHVAARDAEGSTTIALVADDWDRPVAPEVITGSWSPRRGSEDWHAEDWHDYNQRVMQHIFEQSCVERPHGPPNMLVALAMPPSTAKQLLAPDGTSLSKRGLGEIS